MNLNSPYCVEVLLHQFKYVVDCLTGNTVQIMANKLIKDVSDDAERCRVYAALVRSDERLYKHCKEFNGHKYSKQFGMVFNVATGKQIHDGNIVSLFDTKKETKKVNKYCAGVLEALERFESAVRAHEMKGAECLEDHFDIEAEYDEAKNALLDLLAQVN